MNSMCAWSYFDDSKEEFTGQLETGREDKNIELIRCD